MSIVSNHSHRCVGLTSVGRSGINLDGYGWNESAGVVAWVSDGVSPITQAERYHSASSAFKKEAELLQASLMATRWSTLIDGLQEACRDVSHKLIDKHLASSDRPLYSFAGIQVSNCEDSTSQIDYILYGDCSLAIITEDRISIVENRSLSLLTRVLDLILWVTYALSPNPPADSIKRSIFRLIRRAQVIYGLWRVLDVRQPRLPSIKGTIKTTGNAQVLLMSDGASWFVQSSESRIRWAARMMASMQFEELVQTIRDADDAARGFGSYDDLTMVLARTICDYERTTQC